MDAQADLGLLRAHMTGGIFSDVAARIKRTLYLLKDPMNSGNCSCDPGWAGVSCDSECSEHGNITQAGECECYYDDGWKGPLCDIPGCPGLDKLDCSGRGMLVNVFNPFSSYIS